MKRADFWLATALALTLVGRAAVAAEVIDRVVLRVNDEIVTYTEYEARKQARLESISGAEGLTTEERRKLAADAGRASMRELLDEALVLSRARQLRVEPTPAQLATALDSTRERMGFANDEEFGRALAESGLTRESYKQRMKQNLAFNEVMQREVQSQVKVEDDVLLRLYRDSPERWRTPERRRVEELVVLEGAAPDGQQRMVIAEDLLRSLRGGESMQAIADRIGADAVAGPIDLGWVRAGELAPELDRVVQSLAAGGISEPVSVRSGIHLVAVREIQPAGLQPFDEVKETLRVEESRRLFEEKTRKFLEDLERKAYLVENVPPEAEGYRTAVLENPEAAGALGDFAPGSVRPTGEGVAPTPPAAATPADPQVEPPTGERSPAN